MIGSLVFNFTYDKLGSDATPLFKIWRPAWSFAKDFFFSGQNSTFPFLLGPFFVSFSLHKELYSAFDISMIIYFPKANSSHVWIFSRARCAQNMQITWKTSPRWAHAAKTPPGESPRYRLWLLHDWLTFIWNYVFLNKSGAFGNSKAFFLLNVR